MDDVITRFGSAITFTVLVDGSGTLPVQYVTVSDYPLSFIKNINRIDFVSYTDYGNGTGQASFSIKGLTTYAPGVTEAINEQNTLNIENVLSNSYTGVHTFLSLNFLFWYFCDQHGMAITS